MHLASGRILSDVPVYTVLPKSDLQLIFTLNMVFRNEW